MINKQVARILDEVGTLLDLRGENPFKCRAYHNASRIIAGLTEDIDTLVKHDGLKNIKGIGRGLAEKIDEFVRTGRLEYYEELKLSIPDGLKEMLRIPGLGPRKVRILYDTLKIETIEQLGTAAKNHALENIDGFGAKTGENILKGIEFISGHRDKHLFPQALESAEKILLFLKNTEGIVTCEIAGSLRRRKEIIGDIDIIASAKPRYFGEIMDAFTAHPDVERITARGDTKTSVLLKSGISCDLRLVLCGEFPFALAYFTGSKEHNIEMRSLAKQFGLSLNEYGFSAAKSRQRRGHGKNDIKCSGEPEIYRALKLQYIQPELREGMGEIEAAQASALPELVRPEDIRGTLHCHTDFSDGKNTLGEMADAARARGWEYLGIADHSKSAGYAGGLSAVKVKQQLKNIEQLNTGYRNFRLLKSTEADILPDGSLDWDDRLLARFDFVIASIHSKFRMTEAEATKRTIKALKNKYVTVLGHPTGRLLLEREGYPIDMREVIQAAADYGKMIEINAHPMRLDLDWRMCKFAKEKGVKICINPDAHDISGLDDIRFGIGTARKGWLGKTDVLNSLSLKEIMKIMNIEQ